MSKQRVVDVYCKNGHLLFKRYRKVGLGKLIKCYIDEIRIDQVGVSGLKNETMIYCPFCEKEDKTLRVGRIGLVHGRPAVILNQGGIRQINVGGYNHRNV